MSVHAQFSVTSADIQADGLLREAVQLPFYYEGGQTSLKSVSAKYRLPPASDLDSKFYGVLIPYPIQGGQVFLNGRLIHNLEWSNKATFFSWYRPILLNLSASDLSSTSENFLEFRQVGHLRGWSVLPLFFDEISKLRRLYDLIFYLTQTLVETINYLCGFVGFFLIVFGVAGREKKYLYPGIVAVVWMLLFKLALWPQFDTSNWFVWRLSLYCLTGNVILFSILFLFEFFSIRMNRRALLSVGLFCQLGWFVFLLSGGGGEFYLDQYWTGAVVLLYLYCVFVTFWGRSGLNKVFTFLFFAYLVVSGVFALHDFIVQAGFVFNFDDQLFTVVGNAVYLSHFSLPAFLLTSCALLFVDYFQQVQRNARIRDEILSDVHDGVGARLNVLLMGLEVDALDWTAVKEDVRRCIDELRFVLLPESEKTCFLLELMTNFCHSLLARFEKKGVKFRYSIDATSCAELTPRIALVLYFALLECLSNVVKHASSEAKVVSCVLGCSDGVVTLNVADDGPGFRGWRNDLQRFVSFDAKRSLGLRSLIARVQGAGGRVLIESEVSTFTRIQIQFALKCNATLLASQQREEIALM